MRISVKDVAKLMNASEQFVRRGLQSGVFQWGYAVKISNRYTYWISKDKFTMYTGIEVENERL